MKKRMLSVIDVFDLESPYVTEFRRLLSRMLSSKGEREVKSILLTSAMLSEGKSTVCTFLALTAARKKGLRTLIIDADMRRPSINKFFGLSDKPGLAEVLIDGYNTREAINKTAIDKLDILTAGGRCPNPTEVFDAEVIGTLINEMKFYYDLVLVDCAPILPVSDPMLLAPKVDGILLVVKAGTTQKEVVQRAIQIIGPQRDNILGVALNNMNHSLPYYYDYSYYHYDYQQKPMGAKRPAGRGESAGRAKKTGNNTSPLPEDDVRRHK